MLVVGPDLQREAVATNGSFVKYRLSDGRDLPLDLSGQGEIARCSRYDYEEDWAGGHLDLEGLPNFKAHEGLCDGRHQVLREVAHGGFETNTAGQAGLLATGVDLPRGSLRTSTCPVHPQARSEHAGSAPGDPTT